MSGKDDTPKELGMYYDAMFSNNGSIRWGEIPDELVLAVRNAVESGISHRPESGVEILETNSGLVEEENTSTKEQSIAVGVKTSNKVVATGTMNEVVDELEQVVDLELESFSVTVTRLDREPEY